MTDFNLAEFDPTEWLKALGPYQNIILLAALLPSTTSWVMPSGTAEFLNPAYISLAIVLIGFFASKHNFSGPLRYGIARYGPSLQGVYKKLPGGAIWALLLFRAIVPWTQTWLVTLLSIGWQYTLQHFREDVRNVTNEAHNLCARASMAAAQAQADLAAVARYQADALAGGATMARDARKAQGVGVGDFFEAASTAFTAVQSAVEAIEQAQIYSAEATQGRVRAVETIMGALRTARDRGTDARKAIQGEEERVLKVVRRLLRKSSTLPAEVAKLAEDVQAVRHQTSLAVAKAEEGRTADAATLMRDTTAELEKLEVEVKRIAGVKAEIQGLLVSQVLGAAEANRSIQSS
ncbi:hypothetical protein F5Y19DRAFT_414021 [Xylariaceae sp. FL1651]|nr:hypothetical protein F5Y19DRAFT_414021 [Xylariaceae sp. FL1651]